MPVIAAVKVRRAARSKHSLAQRFSQWQQQLNRHYVSWAAPLTVVTTGLLHRRRR